MNIKKWKLFFFICMIPSLFISGCVQGNLHVTVHKDGSGIYQWKVLANARVQKYIKHITSIYSHKGYEAKFIRENGQVGFIATKPVKNIAKEPLDKEVNEAIPTELIPINESKEVMASKVNNSSTKPMKELTVHSGFWKTSILYQTQVNMQKNINHLAGPYATYLSGLLDKLKFRFHLTLPIAPTRQNANAVSKDGKTLTWNLKLGQNNPIALGIDVPTPIVLLVATASNQTKYIPNFWTLAIEWIVVVFASIAFFVYFIRILFRKK